MRFLRLKRILLSIGIVLLLSPMPAGVFSQSGSTQGARSRPDPVQRELQRLFESEAIEQALAEKPRLHPDDNRRLVLTQIKDDFLQMQVVNNALQNATLCSPSADLKAVSKSAAQIAKRAQRLKENLVLPKVEGEGVRAWPAVASDIERLKLSASALSEAIGLFVTNPVFEKLGVVDANLSAKASRDLEQIILASKEVKRTSERLRRGHK